LNGFDILGVRPAASEAEIKAAYLHLARLYHPDRFAGTPQEAAAQERMRRINAAYDYILKNRAKPQPQAGRFAAVYKLLQKQQTQKALAALERITPRNAAWHATAAQIYAERGWTARAVINMREALRQEPGNMRYRRLLAVWQNALQVNVACIRPPERAGHNSKSARLRESIGDRIINSFFY